jgi:hypothetical protein
MAAATQAHLAFAAGVAHLGAITRIEKELPS